MPVLSRDSSWWKSAGHSPECSQLNNQQTIGRSLNKCKYLKRLGNCQHCWTCLLMPPGETKEGTHSNGHNSTTVGPIEQKLMFLKSSDTALHSDRQQNINKHLEWIEINITCLRHLGDCWLCRTCLMTPPCGKKPAAHQSGRDSTTHKHLACLETIANMWVVLETVDLARLVGLVS